MVWGMGAGKLPELTRAGVGVGLREGWEGA